MRTLKRPRLFAALFSLTLATVLGTFTYASWAAPTGRMFVYGPASATCNSNGTTVPASYQDSTLGIELQDYWNTEPVLVSFTFPDGRVFSPIQAEQRDTNSLSPRASIINGLDGVVDMPPNFPTDILYPFAFTTSIGGNFYDTFTVTNKWPYGCYTFTSKGVFSGRLSSAYFVVAPRVGSQPNAGPASLSVQDNTTGDPSGLHGTTVDLFGRGFAANELISVWITAPDGAVITYPFQPTSDQIGSFATGFTFDAKFETGRYAFTALGTQSGYQVIGYFDLAARNSQPAGWASLRVAVPFPPRRPQGTDFEVQGKNFDPYERVDIWVTLPDNSVRGLPSQYAEQNGQFYAVLSTDERLPTGNYAVTAKGASSGRLTITRFDLTQGSQVVSDFPPDADPAPAVIENGTPFDPGTTGPTIVDPNLEVKF